MAGGSRGPGVSWGCGTLITVPVVPAPLPPRVCAPVRPSAPPALLLLLAQPPAALGGEEGRGDPAPSKEGWPGFGGAELLRTRGEGDFVMCALPKRGEKRERGGTARGGMGAGDTQATQPGVPPKRRAGGHTSQLDEGGHMETPRNLGRGGSCSPWAATGVTRRGVCKGGCDPQHSPCPLALRRSRRVCPGGLCPRVPRCPSHRTWGGTDGTRQHGEGQRPLNASVLPSRQCGPLFLPAPVFCQPPPGACSWRGGAAVTEALSLAARGRGWAGGPRGGRGGALGALRG